MINFKLLRKFTHIVDGVRFISKPGENYAITYFSENSTFLEDYSKLNIKLIDVRTVIVPTTKIPRTRLLPQMIKEYKKFRLLPYSSTMKPPKGRNIIYDITNYTKALEVTFKPSNYRQRLSLFIRNMISQSFFNFKDYEKVLIYSIDLSKDFNKFIDRKFFPLLEQLKNDNYAFDHLILCLLYPTGETRYRLLVKNKEVSLQRIITILKTIKVTENIETVDNEEEDEEVANEVIKTIEDKIEPKNKEKVKDAIKSYIAKDLKTKEKVMSKKITKKDAEKIGTASILYKVSGDLKNAKTIAKKLPKKMKEPLKSIDKRYSDQLLSTDKLPSSDENTMISKSTDKSVFTKSPKHLFEKRLIDFEVNLQKDITNSFKVLETKELPFKVQSIEIREKQVNTREIERSDINTVKAVIKDEFGKSHNILIDIPKIDPKSGTFKVNGQKKCLINQIVLCPITFLKPFESRFESSYSVFRIRSKRTKKQHYLEIFIANSWLPLSVLLFFSFGFDETLKQYGIKYNISNVKPKKSEIFSLKIKDDEYIYFHVSNDLQAELIQSLINTKISLFKIDSEFGSKEYWRSLITKITGKVNAPFLINSNLENIVDPVAKQVLINQQLPSNLKDIMFYMAFKVIQGFVQDRNDILNQRIRGSEVLVHLLQKQILVSYTIYKQQVLSGNKDAKFEINRTKLLSEFIQSEIVANMEYANPIEEMAVMTRISPVGKAIGGIPDKTALQNSARNIHPSYYGNIDPLDTPEGGIIGISQQLAIGASITSARGLFHAKDFDDSERSGILSTTSNMIPFIENNDGARMIMATNQAKQSLPLKNPEPPVVRSGYESILTNILSDAFVKKSPCDGKIKGVSKEFIYVTCKNNKTERISIEPVHLKSGSGKDNLSIFTPTIKPNQVVKQNQIIAQGSCISQGAISLGRTLCTAVMPYKGYNFEDGIIINEKLISDDKLTSLHGIIEEVILSENDRLLELGKVGVYIEKGQPILRKTIGEIEQLIGFSEEENEEVIGQQFIKKSPGGRIVEIEVFSNVGDDIFPLLKELSIKTRQKYKTKTNEKFSVKGKTVDGILIRFKIEQELKISLGDKLCNRSGAKGIISLVEKNEDMPRTPWGEHVDIIVNPIGIIARSNIGQLYELYSGLISRELGQRIRNTKNKNQIINLFKNVYSLLDNTKNKQLSSRIVQTIATMPEKSFNELMNQMRMSGFVPIVVPPFYAPTQQQIKQTLTFLNLKTGYQLFLPSYNIKTKSDVPVGYMYFSKLEHLAAEKIYGRSTGPVTSKTFQPTSGKQRDGGQRFGEADTYALISYNCPTVLSELMGPLSDDLSTKNEMVSEIIHSGSTTYREAKISPAKDLLNSYFISLMLERV